MRFTTFTTATLAALLVATPALARADDDDRHDRGRRGTEYAKVVSANPIYRSVRISTPREECVDERVVYREGGRARGGDVLLGAALGGVAGHQFGKGRGNAAATAAGALLGAAIAQNRWGTPETERVVYEPRCTTVTETRYEERIDGYDVAYRYNGRIYHTRTDRHPGKRIPVRVDVSPVSYADDDRSY